MDLILNNEMNIRLGFFLGAFALLALCEWVAPKRILTQSKVVRWYSNVGIVVFNVVIVSIIFPLVPVAVAFLAAERDWGVLNFYDVAPSLHIVISLIILDLAIYVQHVMLHALPVFWRLHRMHHADQDFDVTTGIRFHPIEIVLSTAIKMVVVILIGAPVIAVVIFEVLINVTAMFNHSNVKLPLTMDRVLRLVVVTPDMHRVHHSIMSHENNTNFGFNLPWWDHLFGTYRDQPESGHESMEIGLDLFRTPKDLHLHRLLIQPFTGVLGEHPTNRRDFKK